MNLYLVATDDDRDLVVWARTRDNAVRLWRDYFDLDDADIPDRVFQINTQAPTHAKALGWHRDIRQVF